MAKKSGYLNKLQSERKYTLKAVEYVTRQLMLDTLQVSIHEEFGFGHDRVDRLIKKWMENYELYRKSTEGGDEADYYQEKLDRALAQIHPKEDIPPFKVRYPEIKDITY